MGSVEGPILPVRGGWGGLIWFLPVTIRNRLGQRTRRRSVVERRHVPLDIVQDLRISLHVGARSDFQSIDDAARGSEVAGELEALHDDLLVGGRGEPAGVDDGRVVGVGGVDGDVTAGEGGDAGDGEGGVVGGGVVGGEGGAGDGEELEVGPVGGKVGEVVEGGGGEGGAVFGGELGEADEVAADVGEGAGLGGAEVEDGLVLVGGAFEDLVGWDVDFVAYVEVGMVPGALADAFERRKDWDAEALERRGRSNARYHQQLRRLEYSCSGNHLLGS